MEKLFFGRSLRKENACALFCIACRVCCFSRVYCSRLRPLIGPPSRLTKAPAKTQLASLAHPIVLAGHALAPAAQGATAYKRRAAASA
jgi:hypothetical protein